MNVQKELKEKLINKLDQEMKEFKIQIKRTLSRINATAPLGKRAKKKAQNNLAPLIRGLSTKLTGGSYNFNLKGKFYEIIKKNCGCHAGTLFYCDRCSI